MEGCTRCVYERNLFRKPIASSIIDQYQSLRWHSNPFQSGTSFVTLDGTHAYRYYRHLEIVGHSRFLFLWSRNEFRRVSETKARCLWLSQNYSGKILIWLSFTLLHSFPIVSMLSLFATCTAYKYLGNDISSVTYRRGDSCRNSLAWNFNIGTLLYPHGSHWQNARKAGKWVNIQESVIDKLTHVTIARHRSVAGDSKIFLRDKPTSP